jgi:uncharacterized protein YkwD
MGFRLAGDKDGALIPFRGNTMKKHPWIIAVALLGAGGVVSADPYSLPIPPSVLKEVATGGGSGSTGPAAKADAAKVADLKAKALGDDMAVALPAVRQLKGLGNVGRPALIEVLKTLLTRDQDAIRAAVAGIGDGKEAAEFESKINTLRAEARANVPLLDKAKHETIKKAHDYYDQLVPMTAKMNQAWAMRMAIVNGMGRRAELIGMWREVAPAKDASFPVKAETTLKQSAVAAVGDFVERASGLNSNQPPRDESLKPLWFFGVSRKIEAWNKQHMESFMDPGEIKNFAMVNTYREAIGLMPFEADPRLVQTARRHSKEMVDLKYFSHESPTASEKDFVMRSKNAGYNKGPAGENIAYGGGSGEGTFWMWFDSPGHHKNMAGGTNALGVGRWQDHWTQNFGAGPRMMDMGADELAKVKVEGEILLADGSGSVKKGR